MTSPVPWTPWEGQKKAVRFLLEHAAAGLLMDPGLGKTSVSLAAFKILKKKKLARRALVIAPMRPMQLVWPKEREKWSDFAGLTMTALHSDYGKKDKLLYETDSDIYLINPEGLTWLAEGDRFDSLDADVLIVDELTKFKHTNTGRFKTLKPLLPAFRRRWGLTGNPNANGYLDLFGQVFVLDLGAALGRYITHYRRTYFFESGFGGYEWKLLPDSETKIRAKIKPFMLRMEDKDYIDVPAVVDHDIYVDLPPAARRAYDDMEDEMIASLGDSAVSAVSAGVAAMKCRQMANGGIYADADLKDFSGKRVALAVHDEKTRALEALIEELQGTPILVAYQFQHDLDRLRKAFGADLPYIGGGVSLKRAAELEGAWNRGELPYLFGQPDSVSHGLNLQSAGNHLAWYGLTWKYDDYDQMIRRLKRQGSKHKVIFNHRILARDTVDQAMLGSIQAKGKTAAEFLEAMKRYAAARTKGKERNDTPR